MCILLLCLSLVLVACNKNKSIYQLDRVIVGVHNGEETEYDLETFEKLYPGEIENIGTKIEIENNNNMIFYGILSKEINGRMIMTDINGGWIYITFENDEYKEYFNLVEIRYYNIDRKYKELFIGTQLKKIDNIYIYFCFIYSKGEK